MDSYIFIGKREQPVNQRTALCSRLPGGRTDSVVEFKGGKLHSPRAWLLSPGPLLANRCIFRKVIHPPWAFRDFPSEIIIIPSQGYCESETTHVRWALAKYEAEVAHWRDVGWSSLHVVLLGLPSASFSFIKDQICCQYFKIKRFRIFKCGFVCLLLWVLAFWRAPIC